MPLDCSHRGQRRVGHSLTDSPSARAGWTLLPQDSKKLAALVPLPHPNLMRDHGREARIPDAGMSGAALHAFVYERT